MRELRGAGAILTVWVQSLRERVMPQACARQFEKGQMAEGENMYKVGTPYIHKGNLGFGFSAIAKKLKGRVKQFRRTNERRRMTNGKPIR